jgi:hypothetical protein
MSAVAPTEAIVSTKSPHLEAIQVRPGYGAMPFGYCALRDDIASAEPVMFAYVLDQPAHREALRSEILERIAAIQDLSETMATAQVESPTRARIGP